jgi:hypothetical protein
MDRSKIERRLKPLLNHLQTFSLDEDYEQLALLITNPTSNGNRLNTLITDKISTDLPKVSIGNITVPLIEPDDWNLVPWNIAPLHSGFHAESPQVIISLIPISHNQIQQILHHLRWILQKDSLNQDIFLIGFAHQQILH